MASDPLNFGPAWDAYATPGRRKACVLGDLLQLTPVENSYSSLVTYSVVSAPGGSSATISGVGAFTPDVAGQYVLRATAGTANINFTVFVYAVAAYNGLAIMPTAGTRSDPDRRALLQNISAEITPAQLTAINSGSWPTTLNLARFGV